MGPSIDNQCSIAT